MVDWNAEAVFYNDPSLDNSGFYDAVLNCVHHSPNFKGAILALLDDSENPICASHDIQYLQQAITTPRNGGVLLNTRLWSGVSKARQLETALNISGSVLSNAIAEGIDALQGMFYQLPSFTLANSGNPAAIHNQIVGYRNAFVLAIDTLQQVEAASVPAPAAAVPTQSMPIQQPAVQQPVAQPLQVVQETAGQLSNIQASLQGVQQAAIESAGTGDYASVVALLQSVYDVLLPEYTYQGRYQYIRNQVIPANKTNYEVDFGFGIRLFRLNTDNPISLRIGSTSGDEIFLDYLTSPYHLEKIPAGLAFNSIFVTNASNQDIRITLFVMG